MSPTTWDIIDNVCKVIITSLILIQTGALPCPKPYINTNRCTTLSQALYQYKQVHYLVSRQISHLIILLSKKIQAICEFMK
jgi:hypothetical protein